MDRRMFNAGCLATAAAGLARPSVAGSDVMSCTLMTITYDAAPDDLAAPISVTDLALRSLPRYSFATSTIWTSGVQQFTGVPLLTLLEHYGIKGRELELSAVNHYRITIPMSDIGQRTPLVAYERNGKPMSARDYGPLWLVYDYDGDPASRTKTAFSRSIWQLDQITVTR